MKLKLLLPALLLMCFSCKVMFVPKQSADALAMIEKGQHLTDKLFTGIETGPDRSYAAWENDYTASIDAVNSLILIDKARPKSGNLLVQDKKLYDALVRYREIHLTRGEITEGMAGVFKVYIQSFWNPRINSEKTLKP
jgi:hypothetical protein